MFMSLSVTAAAETENLSVLTPLDKTFVESELLSVVVIVRPGAFDTVGIKVNNREYSGLKKQGNYHISADIKLDEGSNRITISGMKGLKILEERKLEVFHREELSGRDRVAPPGFKMYYFHTSDNEKKCKACHRFETEQKGNAEQSRCLSCHKRITEHSFVHGPSAVGSCETCHSRASDKRSKTSRNSAAEPYSKICHQCHGDSINSWNALDNRHGPYALGNCTICHDPHGSDYPYFTRKHTTSLCVSCHEEKASGAHVVVSFAGRSHPVRGKPDPLNNGKELTCASCHNPHASKFSSLLFQDEKKDSTGFCMSCHKFLFSQNRARNRTLWRRA